MILKYVLLALTNILAFAGAWVFAFTETDKQSGRKKLTKWGKIALPVAFLLLIAGFGLTIYDDAESQRKADIAGQAAEKKEKELQTKIDQLTADVSRSAVTLTLLRNWSCSSLNHLQTNVTRTLPI